MTVHLPNVNDMTLAAAALAYAGHGWHVFPLAPGGKTPIGGHGQNDATTDREQVAAWWSATPQANIGIACRPSGLFAVDLDVKDGIDGPANWEKWKAEHGWSPMSTWS